MASNHPDPNRRCIAFNGCELVADGPLPDVALRVKRLVDRQAHAQVLMFDAASSEPIELDLRGTPEAVLGRLDQDPASLQAELTTSPEAPAPRATGRPRLGVVAREVTLLPRHWDWLSRQPGGASVTLRRLIDDARRTGVDTDRVRQAQESCYRFMSALAGNLPGFEEAARALFAADSARFAAQTQAWPEAVRRHAQALAAPALPDVQASSGKRDRT